MKILFLCLGNICRSQMAEAVFRHLLKERQLEDRFTIDSAGTSDEEHGNPIYPPARQCLSRHGVNPGNHHARQVTQADYDHYDLLILMEEANRRQLRRIIPNDPEGKIHLLLDYVDNAPRKDIADPWYTGDFEATYADVEIGCNALLQALNE